MPNWRIYWKASCFLSPIGFEFVLTTAAIVLAFAIGQMFSVASIYRGQRAVGVSTLGR